MANIKIGDFSDAIQEELTVFKKDVIDGVNKAAKKVAKDTVNKLKRESPSRSGNYAGSWASKREDSGLQEEKYTIYNKKHYRLTHLLENGHINAKTGGRVRDIPHIAPAEQSAIEEFARAVEEMDL